jgi:hypothetical protein
MVVVRGIAVHDKLHALYLLAELHICVGNRILLLGNHVTPKVHDIQTVGQTDEALAVRVRRLRIRP